MGTYGSPEEHGNQARPRLYPKIVVHCLVRVLHAHVATTDLVINSSLMEHPDLILAFPVTPESNGSTIGRVTVVGQVNV